MSTALMSTTNIGYAAFTSECKFRPWTYPVRTLRPDDVLIEVHFCGICHSDIHNARSEWNPAALYPMVCGHEVSGVVSRTGCDVVKHKVGDRVGVGCMVYSCRNCKECARGDEQYCEKMVQTYGEVMPDGERTYGGYAKYLVCAEHFVLAVPDNISLQHAAPLLCAGITAYGPFKQIAAAKSLRVGVIGLGGVGHMSLQFGRALGHEVFAISRSDRKRELAKQLGAMDLICDDFEQFSGTFDVIMDTVGVAKSLTRYISLLKTKGMLILLGIPPVSDPHRFDALPLVVKGRGVAGNLLGGIEETQEMLDFCSKFDIRPMIELTTADHLETAFERVTKGDVMFRFVIDIRASSATAERRN